MLLILSTFSLLFVVIFAAKAVQKRVHSEKTEVVIRMSDDDRFDHLEAQQLEIEFLELDLSQWEDYYAYLQSGSNSLISDSPPAYETVVRLGSDLSFNSLPPPTYLESTRLQNLPELNSRSEIYETSLEEECSQDFCEYCEQSVESFPAKVFTVSWVQM